MIKPRIIWIIVGGLLLALGLIVTMQMLDVLSRLSGEETQTIITAESNEEAALGISPTLFTDIAEFSDGVKKTLRLSGTAEPSSVVVILDNGERIRQIRSDDDGNWAVSLEAVDDRAMVIEAILFNEAGVTVRGDETIYRVVLPEPSEDEEETQTDEDVEMTENPAEDSLPLEEILPEIRPTLIMVSAPGAPSRIVKSPFGGSPTVGPLTMGPIDYDDAGGVIFSGMTTAEGRIRLYTNDSMIGETRVGATGRWNFIAGRILPRGEHDIRAELIGSEGALAQVDVPFELLPPTEPKSTPVPLVEFEPFRWQVRRELLGGGFQTTVIFAPLEAEPIIPNL